MTKVILHGGTAGSSERPSNNFLKEMLLSTKNDLRILSIYFASDREKWDVYLKQDTELFKEAGKENSTTFHIEAADTTVDQLTQQIRSSDVIYIRGGQNIEALQKGLAAIADLRSLLDDKTIVGSSAGAYVLSSYYLSRRFGIQEGLGIFSIKVSAHFEESMVKDLEMLKVYKEILPTYAIPEQQYVVLVF